MYNFRVYTLRDGSKRSIKLKEGESFKEELQRAGIQETQIFQMQLVEKPQWSTFHHEVLEGLKYGLW